jgi:hypothetical protein
LVKKGRQPLSTAALPLITAVSPKKTASGETCVAKAARSRSAMLAAKLLSAAKTCCFRDDRT